MSRMSDLKSLWEELLQELALLGECQNSGSTCGERRQMSRSTLMFCRITEVSLKDIPYKFSREFPLKIVLLKSKLEQARCLPARAMD